MKDSILAVIIQFIRPNYLLVQLRLALNMASDLAVLPDQGKDGMWMIGYAVIV